MVKSLKESNDRFYEYSEQIIKLMLDRTDKYDFNSASYLFEAIAYLTYWLGSVKSNNLSKLEGIMMNCLQVNIKRGSDLLNFCFQISAIFLLFETGSSQHYENIYNSIAN